MRPQSSKIIPRTKLRDNQKCHKQTPPQHKQNFHIQSFHKLDECNKPDSSPLSTFSSIPITQHLNFIDVSVSATLDKPLFNIPALVDTGANSSIIDLSVLKSNLCLQEFPFTNVGSNSKLTLARQGVHCAIMGHITAYLTFTDKNGCLIPVRTKLLIASGLKHYLYLGNNFLSSPILHNISPKGLMFKKETPTYKEPSRLCTRYHLVPYMPKEKSKQFTECKGKCFTLTSIVLEPFRYTRIPCRFLSESKPIDKIVVDLQSSSMVPSNISVLPIVYDVDNKEKCHLYILNKWCDPVLMPENTLLAAGEEFLPENYSLNHLTSIMDVDALTKDIKLHQTTLQPLQFDCNSLFNDEETDTNLAQEIRSKLDQDGFIQLPMHEVYEKVDSKGSFDIAQEGTEKADPANAMDLNHLTNEQKHLVKELISFYPDCFASSICEITKTNLVELDAIVPQDFDFSKYVIRHKDIPIHDRDECNKVLADMTAAGIIGKVTGPILLVSNLLTRRKRSGKIRIILDNRLSNNISQKIADSGSPPLLTNITEMKQAVLLTSSDLNNSFFQIPTTPFLSSLLCFRGPDRTLYQLNRCAQGYINSSVALSTTVSRMKQLPVLDRELSGMFDSSFLPSYSPSSDEISLLTSRIPKQVLGRFRPVTSDDSNTKQPKYSNLPKSIIKTSRLVSHSNHSAVINYCDDLILYSSHHDENKVKMHQNTLPIDYDDLSQLRKQHSLSSHDTPNPGYYLPSGRFIHTDRCHFCAENDGKAPDMEDFFHHLQNLEILLVKLRKSGLKLSPAKTKIAADTVDILGSTWRPGRLSISEARIQGFRNMQINSAKTLHSAVSSVSYFRSCIPGFSHIAQPLLHIIKTRKFVWGKEQQDAWNLLLDTLSANSTLHIFDSSKPIVVSTDASQHAGSVVLTQSCHGKQRLVAAASRTFGSSEKSYSIFKKEVLSVIYGFDAFAFLLRGCKNIVLEIDSRALLFLKFCKDNSPYLTRLSLIISEYKVSRIIHVNSACHQPADALTRLTHEQRKFKNLLDTFQPMSPKEAELLVAKIAIENGTIFDPNNVENNLEELLSGPSLPTTIPQKGRSQTSQAAKLPVTLRPLLKHERTIRPPVGIAARNFPHEKFRLPKKAKRAIAYQKRLNKMYDTRTAKENKERYTMPQPPKPKTVRKLAKRYDINVITRSASKKISNETVSAPVPNEPTSDTATDPLEETIPVPPDPPQNIEDVLQADEPATGETDEVSNNDSTYDTVHLFGKIVRDGTITLKTLSQLQQNDDYFGPIFRDIGNRKYLKSFKIKNNILFHTKHEQAKLCIPYILLKSMVIQNHHSIYNIHASLSSLLKKLQSKYFHPQLKQVAEQVCKDCVLCSVALSEKFRESSLGVLAQGNKRELFYCDLALISQSPAAYLFLAVDSYSLFTFATALKDKSEESLYKAVLSLCTTFMCNHLKFDNETGIFPLIPKLKLLGITVDFTAVGSSFSNGLVEKRVGMSKEICRILTLMNSNLTPDEKAILVSHNLNRKIALGSKYTPEMIMYNQTLSAPNDLIQITSDYTKDDKITEEFENSLKNYMDKRKERTDTQRSRHNMSRRKVRFQKGDLVFVSNRNLIIGQKGLKCTKTGPFTIEQIEDSGHTAVLRNIATNAIIKRRTSYLSNACQDFTNLLLNDAFPNQILDEVEEN